MGTAQMQRHPCNLGNSGNMTMLRRKGEQQRALLHPEIAWRSGPNLDEPTLEAKGKQRNLSSLYLNRLWCKG